MTLLAVHTLGGPTTSTGSMTARDVIRTLKRRTFLILAIWIGFSAAFAALVFFLEKYHPVYRANCYILVESPHPKTPMQLQEPAVPVDQMNRYVFDQVVLIKDKTVLNDALQDIDIQLTRWYRTEPDKSKLLEQLRENLLVTQIPDSSYLLVSFSAKNAKEAAHIVNTVVEKYLAKVHQMSYEEYSSDLDRYQNKVKHVEKQVAQARQKTSQFAANELIASGVTAKLVSLSDVFRTLTTELIRMESQKLQLKAVYENMLSLPLDQIEIAPEMASLIQDDPQLAAMKKHVFNLQRERETSLQRVGPKHRTVHVLDDAIAKAQASLEQAMRNKKASVCAYQTSSAETAFLNAAQAELHLREALLTQQSEQRNLEAKLAQYRRLEEDQSLLEQQYNQIVMFAEQLRMMVHRRGIVRVQRIDEARPPRSKSLTRWGTLFPAGSAIGLLLGAGLSLLLEIMDTSVRTTRDIVRSIHVPILGTVPDLDDEEVHIDTVEMASYLEPRSMVAESFRTIRTNLLLSTPEERQRTILVTSAKPEEGKTSVATNLAVSIAQSGQRVLLVDANFHRPAMHQLFPNLHQQGLSNVLLGQLLVNESVNATDMPNLDVMTTGPIPPNPAELLAGTYLQDLITQVTKQYDQIIFDGPPLLLVSDALVIASLVDGIILVSRAAKTLRGSLQRARRQLDKVNGRILGAILNAAQVQPDGYFREQIRSYYEYEGRQFTRRRRRTQTTSGDG